MTDLPFDLELDTRLRELSRQVVFPPTPAIASAVIRSISAEPPPAPKPALLERSRYAFWTAALLIFVAVAVAVIPSTRHAVARWLDVPGIHISWTDDSNHLDVQTEIRLGLGDHVSL
ncbi:MAG: hypothetical protein ACRDHN_11100, partial [Thermomicrobiales bacterium]